MKTKHSIWFVLFTLLVMLLTSCKTDQETPEDAPILAGDTDTEPSSIEIQFPPAEIINDEGGPVFITGEVAYTYPFFTAGVAEPIVILEDQTGFVDRDRNFLFPVESQVLGQITSDFYESPFSYNITLPLIPRGTQRDVDNDGETDDGVMVFAVAYWTNTWGDAYLERRDQYGGGWSSAYASTRISDDRDHYLEVYGGKYVVYAADGNQGFPSGFGDDDLLFTDDDPIVQVPQGWTVVDMDQEPFSFDRSREAVIDLLEPESMALSDFSSLPYPEAFDAMLEKMRTEYAFTEYKGIDWDALAAEFRPRFEAAEEDGDTEGYYLALRDFLWSIPDGHVGMDVTVLGSLIQQEIIGGLGMAAVELSDGQVLVNYLLEEGPAEQAGIKFGAEITAIDGIPIDEIISATVPWSSPFSTAHTERLEQLLFALRFPGNKQVTLAYTNPGESANVATLTTVMEIESLYANSSYADLTGFELPVEYEILDSGLAYVRITTFFDNELLTIQLWERMMEELNAYGIPGLIIDMRTNGGGSGYLADQMAAYFFEEEHIIGNTSYYDDSIDDFYSDPGDESQFFLPRDELRYDGDIVVIVGPACASACEFFSYDMTIEDRATIMGHYPTAGLGGSVEDFLMPENLDIRFTIGRAVNASDEIHIEGIGVVPDVTVPITQETFDSVYLDGEDVLLDTAVEVLLGN